MQIFRWAVGTSFLAMHREPKNHDIRLSSISVREDLSTAPCAENAKVAYRTVHELFGKKMKSIVTLFLIVFASGTSAFAEERSIVVFLNRPEQGPLKVTLYSDEKTESKKGIDLSEAALILRNAQGWGSGVSVFILSETPIEIKDYLVLLEGMKENGWLTLMAVEVSHGRPFSDSATQLLKHFSHAQSVQ